MPEVPIYIVDGFWGYCQGLQEFETLPVFSSVEEYIDGWVQNDGAAFTDCVGDYRIFLSVVAYIFASWHDQRAKCASDADWHNPIPWQVNRAMKIDRDVSTEIFNPLYFEYHCP